MHDDAVRSGLLGREGEGRSGQQVLGGLLRHTLGPCVTRILTQGQFGQEDDAGTLLGGETDAVSQLRTQRARIVVPTVLHQPDSKCCAGLA